MTRKDYKDVADIIKHGNVDSIYFALEMAKLFARDNPRFDANKFFEAAEVSDFLFKDMDGEIKRK